MTAIKELIYLLLIISMISCRDNRQEVKKQKPLPKSKSEKVVTKKAEEDTIYKDSTMIVLKSEKSIDTLLKFHSKLEDKKFEVEAKELRLYKDLNFQKFEYKKMFITVIKEGVKEEGVNFAGKFCFVSWGCGSPCQTSAVVDMESGIVYNGLPSAVGYKFKKNSRLIIVNPPESGYYYPVRRWVNYPEQYIWTGKKFLKVK